MFARPLIYCYFIRETVCCEVLSLRAIGKNEIRGKFDRMDLLRKSIRISRALYIRLIWALAGSYRIDIGFRYSDGASATAETATDRRKLMKSKVNISIEDARSHFFLISFLFWLTQERLHCTNNRNSVHIHTEPSYFFFAAAIGRNLLAIDIGSFNRERIRRTRSKKKVTEQKQNLNGNPFRCTLGSNQIESTVRMRGMRRC